MDKSPAQLVNPYIGTLPHLLKATAPEVMLPHSYVRTYPLVSTNRDYYCNDAVDGFPVGLLVLMPGPDGASAPEDFRNTLDHALEEAHPYGNRLELERHGIVVESTVTQHVYAYRFTRAARLLIRADEAFEAHEEGGALCVHARNQYACLVFSCPIRILSRRDDALVLALEGEASPVELAAALSFISFDKARLSHRLEAEGKPFDALWDAAYQVWNRFLSRVQVRGNSQDMQTVFYTALYRSVKRMVNYGEHGHYYSGYDRAVHEGAYFYTEDGLWDTYRCMHPLQILLEPERQEHIMESYNLMYLQSGLMPSFPYPDGDRPVMIGFHAAAAFADAAAKGLRVDYQTAYRGIRQNATAQSMLPWVADMPLTVLDACYMEKGFFPALAEGQQEYVDGVHSFERRQAVAVTLEHAYDDWCTAQLARRLGKEEDYAYFMQRARNYRNLFHPGIGWMAPKNIDGAWVEPFDAKWSGGQGGRAYFAENNAWVYTWSVQHDLRGLAELMGGPQAMQEKLDRLFTEDILSATRGGLKSDFLALFPDATGLMGQFSMGNEPAFHIPYLYAYCGAPWKTQKRLRSILDIWFTNSPTGICGDEDGGAMSSFFVFSALGFYPVCPGTDEYVIGTPLFDEADIALENGKRLRIVAQGAGEGLRYIQRVTLHGKPLDRPFFTHADIAEGGELVFEMGKTPNKAWGSAQACAPYSMSKSEEPS